MTGGQLRDLITARLAKERGGGALAWRRVIGDLKVYSLSTHAHCNWDARPSGTIAEIAAVERMIDQIRAIHPIVDEG